MRKTFVTGPRLLALIGAVGLITAPALARDVTVYGGGKSKTVKTGSDRPVQVIAGGENRVTAFQKRVDRFALERKVQTILETRDSDEDRATSDAMMRIILRGNRDARRNYSRYYPYHARSAGFYTTLNRAMQEQKAGVRVYRQSILDDVPSDDLQRVAKALNEIK